MSEKKLLPWHIACIESLTDIICPALNRFPSRERLAYQDQGCSRSPFLWSWWKDQVHWQRIRSLGQEDRVHWQWLDQSWDQDQDHWSVIFLKFSLQFLRIWVHFYLSMLVISNHRNILEVFFTFLLNIAQTHFGASNVKLKIC